jgi:hypothetical protein
MVEAGCRLQRTCGNMLAYAKINAADTACPLYTDRYGCAAMRLLPLLLQLLQPLHVIIPDEQAAAVTSLIRHCCASPYCLAVFQTQVPRVLIE